MENSIVLAVCECFKKKFSSSCYCDVAWWCKCWSTSLSTFRISIPEQRQSHHPGRELWHVCTSVAWALALSPFWLISSPPRVDGYCAMYEQQIMDFRQTVSSKTWIQHWRCLLATEIENTRTPRLVALSLYFTPHCRESISSWAANARFCATATDRIRH